MGIFMRKYSTTMWVLLVIVPCLVFANMKIDVSPLSGARDLSSAFLRYYKPITEEYDIKMPHYSLPIDAVKITNFEDLKNNYLYKQKYIEALSKNGFVVINGGNIDDIVAPYSRLLKEGIPIYVTADTPLHLFHIQFDETLKEIEEKIFYSDIASATRVLLKAAENDYKLYSGLLKEAAKRNVAYFSVALKQFDPDYISPKYVREWVEWECNQIEKHEGMSSYSEARKKSIFRIPEDYSQYKARGHYTRSETLKRYFRGMMWYGRITFLIKGHEKYGPIIPPAEALTDRKTAKIHTLQAALISAGCGQLKLPDGRRISDVWDRIYTITAFYVGFADDLTLYDYRRAMRQVFGSKFSAKELEDEERFCKFILELAKLRPPAIFSGTGGAGIDPGDLAGHKLISIKQLDSILLHTMGFRFMGQRYIPDSYILGQLVSPGAGSVPRRIPPRFTVVYIPDERIQPDLCYSIRGFPRGLDVFSVFGSKRAEQHIINYKDHEYPKYNDQTLKLRMEFSKLTKGDWNRNLYWSWLYLLKTLTEERGKGYQSYMQTDAWLDRQLNTALSSWAALRHNTILYAKQSYTPVFIGTAVEPMPPPPKGLVEPLPKFYGRILATARMAYGGLKDLGVLTPAAEERLSSLINMLERLYDICKHQVANRPLTQEDNEFLAGFPEALKWTIGDVDDKGLKTTIIADVHTELNTKLVLEEASGYVDYIIIAYRRPTGDIILAVGPVLSYHEFKYPMQDRLTDEKWREMLESGQASAQPEWIKSYFRE